MNELEYYTRAREYLLSFDAVSEDMLEAQLNEWKHRRPDTLRDLFRAFLVHAQNRQGMPKSIGEIDKLSELLFDFDYQKVVLEYRDWGELFDSVLKSDYTPPGRMIRENKKSHWVVYCKAILSIAEFMSAYKTLEEFQCFVDGFLTNEQSRLALPLLLSEEIFGFGFALSCDFLKENVSPEFIKPDTHIITIARGLGITESTSSYRVFKDVIAYSRRTGVLPYAVDKMFWLVGSGNFYMSGTKINSSSEAFIANI